MRYVFLKVRSYLSTRRISLNHKLQFLAQTTTLLSRGLECLFPDQRYNDGTPTLVLGDIPLRISKGKQVVFLHSPLLVRPVKTK